MIHTLNIPIKKVVTMITQMHKCAHTHTHTQRVYNQTNQHL